MNKTTIKVVTIVSETCCNCGVVFGMNKDVKERLLETGESFFVQMDILNTTQKGNVLKIG